jgi:hypothetical protein
MKNSIKPSFCFLAVLGFAAGVLKAENGVSVKIHGLGWSEVGRIMHVTDTLVNNVNHNWLQSSGAQFTAEASFGDNWQGAFGFGGYQIYSSLGKAGDARVVRSAYQNFITESRMTYFAGGRESPLFSVTFGNFPYSYNKDAKNLGSYLLRGPVYPGFLLGGFKDFRIDSTKGNVLGFRVNQRMGGFSQDLIFANERDLPPTGDWSLAYAAKYKAFDALEFGAGVNFYRLISANGKLTTPSAQEFTQQDSIIAADGLTHNPYDHAYTEGRIDTVRDAQGNVTGTVYVPTVEYTHRGIKLMGTFSFDIRRLLGLGVMGPNDLKLYGEAAVLGVQNYGTVYKNMSERIPWMVGFNIPTFGILDYMSLEVEHYGAKYRNDLSKLGNFNTLGGGIFISGAKDAPILPSPIPTSYRNYDDVDANGIFTRGGANDDLKNTGMDVQNLTSDDWKWSLYLERSVASHIRFIGQLASDHYRPRPTAGLIQEIGGMSEAFSDTFRDGWLGPLTPKDWYWMFRVGFYF